MQADVILSFCCDVRKAVIHFFRQDETSPGDRVLIKLTASPKSIILFILFSKKAPRRASYFYLSRLKHGLPGPPGRMAHKEDPFHGRHQAPHCKQPWHVRPAERHRNAGHRLCPHGRALPPRHQRRHPFRVRAVRLPRSADGRLFYCQRLWLPQALHPQMHRAAAQDPAQALRLYCTGHHGAPRFHSPRSFRLVGCCHLRIGQGLRRFPVRPGPTRPLTSGSSFSPADPCGT